MAKRDGEQLGNPRARLTGAVYLLYFVAAVSASLLLSAPPLKPLQDLLNEIAFGLYVLLALFFYNLLKPVNQRLSLAATVVCVAGCVAGVLGIFQLLPRHVNPLFFFGPYCVLIGYLILGSTFLPRILGALLMLAGAGWLLFLVPQAAQHLSAAVEGLGVGAEGLLMVWLLTAGVNEQRWCKQERARRKAKSRE